METRKDYQLSTSVNDGIIEIIITGEITNSTVDDLRNEVRTIAWSLNAKALLVDVRAVKERLGVTEAYYGVRSYPTDRSRISTAVVDLPEHETYQLFLETTAYNSGLRIKWFTNIDDARTWLKNMQGGDSESGRGSNQGE